jgi:hypothetical protein
MLPILLLIASWLHPGAETRHRAFLETVAKSSPSEEIAAEELVFAEHESRFGDALNGVHWDPEAHGILQIRGWGSRLDRDEVASARAWLQIRAKAAKACGEESALAGLSSGHCDRAIQLAGERAAEARWLLGIARLVQRCRGR